MTEAEREDKSRTQFNDSSLDAAYLIPDPDYATT